MDTCDDHRDLRIQLLAQYINKAHGTQDTRPFSFQTEMISDRYNRFSH